MGRTVKLILGLIVGLALADLVVVASGLLLVCSIGSALVRGFQTSPLWPAEITASVTDCELLPGPGDVLAPRTFGFSIVSDTGTDERTRIIRLQFPTGSGLEPAEAAGEWRPTIRAGQFQDLRVQAPADQALPAQGRELSLMVWQGKAPGGQAYQQVVATVRAGDRQASVVLKGPRDGVEW